MPQPLDLGIVRRMRAGRVGVRKSAAGDEVHADRQLPFGFIEIDAVHKPRGLNSKCGFKQLIGHDCCLFSMTDPSFCRSQPYSSISASISVSRVHFAGLRPPLTQKLNPLKFQQRLITFRLNCTFCSVIPYTA